MYESYQFIWHCFISTGCLWLIVQIVFPYRHCYLWFCPTFPLALHWNVGSISAKKLDQVNRIFKPVLQSDCKTIAYLPWRATACRAEYVSSCYGGHRCPLRNIWVVATEKNVSASVWFAIAGVPFPTSPICFHAVIAKGEWDWPTSFFLI
jgi:hypothetical protein